MSARRFIPAGRLAEYVPAHPDRTSLRVGRSWDSDVEVREWPSRGAMLTACRMSDTGKLGAPAPMRDYLASRYPAALAFNAKAAFDAKCAEGAK